MARMRQINRLYYGLFAVKKYKNETAMAEPPHNHMVPNCVTSELHSQGQSIHGNTVTWNLKLLWM